jgi:5-methylcytosine-specific restriction enzyme A
MRKKTKKPERGPDCPECGQRSIPIVYGLPAPETREAAEAGWIALGGCLVWDGMPTWQCSNRHTWGHGTLGH